MNGAQHSKYLQTFSKRIQENLSFVQRIIDNSVVNYSMQSGHLIEQNDTLKALKSKPCPASYNPSRRRPKDSEC